MTAVHADAFGDAPSGGLDLLRVSVADDDTFVFIRIEAAAGFDLSENNNLVLYLDTDDDVGTGMQMGVYGVELEWHFGQRQGTYYSGGNQFPVTQSDIRFRAGPTIDSSSFEIAISRSASPDGVRTLFGPTPFGLLLRDGATGDALPEAGATFTYMPEINGLPPIDIIPFERDTPADFRIVTWNVLNDSPWNPGSGARFGRQLQAVDPDVIAFQEIYNHSIAEIITFVEQWVDPKPGQTWTGAGSPSSDTSVISRVPILDWWPIDGNMAALIGTSQSLDHDILVFSVHLPCCGNNAGRQREVDRILQFIRTSREPGDVELPANTPIVFTGDTNFVGLSQQVTSILTGDIVDEAQYGPDFSPDPDGTSLTNIIFRQTEWRMGYTWRSDSSSFWPGHLDYIVYSDSLLSVANHFAVYTPNMSPASLTTYSLSAADSTASDHLLLCADFRAGKGPNNSVPAVSEWGLIVAILLMLVMGTLLAHRTDNRQHA